MNNLVTELILETFRLNGRLLSVGDNLVSDLGINSARWQVMGAIVMSAKPAPVAHLARVMGLSRQAVQRLVNEMEAAGLVRFEANPNHQRAKLVLLTKKGASLYEEASARQAPWAASLGSGLSQRALETSINTLRAVRVRLEEARVDSHEE